MRIESRSPANTSPLSALEGPVYTRLDNDDIEMRDGLRPPREGTPVARNDSPATPSDYASSTARKHPEQQALFLKSGKSRSLKWTMETCSYALSIIALAGLVVTLLVHQNEPLPQWPQLVTINSIISLFSLIMRACAGTVLAEGLSQCKWNWYRKARRLDHIEQLDSASRGSWGSITLLFYSRLGHIYLLAALGAFVTILASLTGFFSQQLVQFNDCAQRDTALATISKTNSYARTGDPIQSNVFADYAPMISAINVGVFQNIGDLTSTLSSGCSSGNCTFSDVDAPAFSTLAISHFCQNSTANIRAVNDSRASNASSTQDVLEFKYGNNHTFRWTRQNAGVVVQSWTTKTMPGIIGIYFLFRPHWKDTNWSVVNCTLLPTIDTYSASIRDAVLSEILTNTTYLASVRETFAEPTVGDVDFNNLAFSYSHRATMDYAIRNGTRASCEGSSTEAPGFIKSPKSTRDPTYMNSTGDFNPSRGWKWWFFPGVWTIRKSSTVAMQDTLDDVFNDQNVTMGYNGGALGSSHLTVLFQSGAMNIDSINRGIGNLATSMSTVFRTHGGLGNMTSPVLENTFGTVWVNTTCVYVRWKWITFPAVMIGLTGVFLMLVAIENRGMEADRLWKSSFLAALFCEVEVDEKMSGKEAMRASARATSVSLQKDTSRLRLVRG